MVKIKARKNKDLTLLFKSTALRCGFKPLTGSYETKFNILKFKFSGKRLEANNNNSDNRTHKASVFVGIENSADTGGTEVILKMKTKPKAQTCNQKKKQNTFLNIFFLLQMTLANALVQEVERKKLFVLANIPSYHKI